MPRLASLFVALFAVHAAFAQQSGVGSADRRTFPLGVVIPKVVTIAKPDQSYALYLPTSYSLAKRRPIVYVFDPGARGSTPVELMKDAAERYGYIVVGSNNSRNGSWPIESEAAQVMFQDTHGRFPIDPRRVYLFGHSGGAGFALQMGCLESRYFAAVAIHAGSFIEGEEKWLPLPSSPRWALTISTIPK